MAEGRLKPTWQRSRRIHMSHVSQTKKCRSQRTLNTKAWVEKRLNLLGRKWESWKKDRWVTVNWGRLKKKGFLGREGRDPLLQRDKGKRKSG